MSPTPSSAPAVHSGSNPWFAVSMGLMGLIVGYGLHSVAAPLSATVNPPTQVGQVPTVPEPEPTPPAEPPTLDDDPVLGDEDATVALVEFTDYQCPFCSRHFEQTYGKIKENYVDTGKVKLVVRDYPLSFHPHAQKASEATECADDQGKFFEMHDKIFATQQAWSNAADAVATFKQYAADLKLNTATFNDCLDSSTHAEEVQKDLADGSASGISGTPGFWILGPDDQSQQISGAYPYETFAAAFDAMLE